MIPLLFVVTLAIALGLWVFARTKLQGTVAGHLVKVLAIIAGGVSAGLFVMLGLFAFSGDFLSVVVFSVFLLLLVYVGNEIFDFWAL